MKVAILAAPQPGFIPPMARGFKKMLGRLEVEAEIFTNGLAMLNYSHTHRLKTAAKNGLKSALNMVRKSSFLLQQNVTPTELKAFETRLGEFDLIVVICHIPDAFLADKLCGIERLRQQFKTPIVLYQNYYLPTRGDWAERIKARGGFGLERYDWYLPASVVSEYALTQDVLTQDTTTPEPHRFSLIGHDLRDDSLFVESNKADKPFKVLLDFERKGFEAFRALQIEALEQTNTDYTQLSGRYSLADIRQIYRQHSALFLSFRESFGLPVVENQLCGNFIFAPHKKWVPSHYIDKPLHQAGEGALGVNFRIYDNQLETLKAQIIQCRENYQPKQVVVDFKRQYPQLYHGDLEALQGLLAKVGAGNLHTPPRGL